MPACRTRVLAAALVLGLAAGAHAHTNERGLDAQNMDAATAACGDFFQHANGGWLASNPPGMRVVIPERSWHATQNDCVRWHAEQSGVPRRASTAWVRR